MGLERDLLAVDPSLRRVLDRIASDSAQRAAVRGGRAAHAVGTTLSGWLRVVEAPHLPAHAVFTPGRRFPVLLRHSNARGFADDAVADGRGAALRLLRNESQFDNPILDLVLVTGRRFVVRDAATFVRWATGDAQQRSTMLAADPRIGDALWELIRNPDSYTQLEYYSQTTYQFIGLDSQPSLVRYRLRTADTSTEHGLLPREDLSLPLEYVPRQSGDTRSTTYLQDELRARLAAGPVSYVLQLQLRPEPTPPGARTDALDATQPWSEEAFPWCDTGLVELDRVVNAVQAEGLRFNPGNSPPELGVIPATSAEDPASINHARVLAYTASAHARLEGSTPSLREALVDAARSLHPDHLPYDGSEPRTRIAAALGGSSLRHFPRAVARLLDDLEHGITPSGGEVPRALFERLADLAARFGVDPAATEDWVQAYRPVCLEMLRWRDQSSLQLYTSHAEFRASLERTRHILPSGFGVPLAIPLDTDTVVAVVRFGSLEPDRRLVILSEYACSIKRDSHGWRVQAALETEYREESGDAVRVQDYLGRSLEKAERELKLYIAHAGGLLVDVFEESRTSRRVCVIGAGPAGLSAARELERLGHQVTVLEWADSVAGKCASLDIDGRPYDLGGHLFGGSHQALMKLAAEMGCSLEAASPSFVYDLDAGAVEPRGTVFSDKQVRAYRQAKQAAFSGIERRSLAEAGDTLARPAGAWLAEHSLDAVATARVAYTASGYGFVSDPELPALYPVKFTEMLGLLSGDAAPRWTVAGGMMALWRRVARDLRDVRLGVRVAAIERNGTGVHVRADHQTLDFDELVLALPLERALEFLDTDAEERDLFGRIRYVDYHTTVCTIRGLPRNGFYLIRQHTDNPATRGHCVAFHHRYSDSDVYTCYAYGGPGGTAGVQRLLREDVERMGGHLEAIHAERRFAYAPRVTSADLEAHFFRRLEALQGRANTYYVGSLLSFELMECAVGYSQELVRRHFASSELTAVEGPPVNGRSAARTRADSISADSIRTWLVAQVAGRLDVPSAEVDPDVPVEAYALSSLAAVSMIAELSHWLDWEVTPSVLVEYPTVTAIAEQLALEIGSESELVPAPSVPVGDDDRGSLLQRLRRAFD